MPTLILLGAVGGALRGVLDAYVRFQEWQSERRVHRRLPPGLEGEPPRFQTYFDPAVDCVAAGVHSLLGAGAAVLLGTTGQISGAYAAVVVGLSAPVILTQLGRVNAVNDAVTGGVGAEAGDGSGSGEETGAARVPASSGEPGPPAVDTGSYVAGVGPRTGEDGRGAQAVPVARQSEAAGHGLSRAVPAATEAVAGVRETGSPPGADDLEPQSNGLPPGRGRGGQSAPRLSHGPAVGEEGTP
ncbi:hypothetical protein ACH4TV_08915 [Streptomyces sp. NPDC020898]|uniref:hypothetical protein n=1 Tax=Streptomyces sp. NPDC020898 TaxID=3365101 RepID=UPI0037BD0C62